MWHVRDLELRDIRYDFSSAGLGRLKTRALFADGHRILNAVDLVDLEPDGCIQVVVCEQCGIVHCEPGGWVQLRKLDSGLLWTPCFSRHAAGEWETREYRPPPYLRTHGVPFFDARTLGRLVEMVPGFAGAEPPRLTERETCLVLQWEAPARVLGEPGHELRLRRELVLATESGDLATQLATLEALLAAAERSARTVGVVPAHPASAFYLDVAGTPEWLPLAADQTGRPLLALGRELAVAPR